MLNRMWLTRDVTRRPTFRAMVVIAGGSVFMAAARFHLFGAAAHPARFARDVIFILAIWACYVTTVKELQTVREKMADKVFESLLDGIAYCCVSGYTLYFIG
jgi:hypothetical protein